MTQVCSNRIAGPGNSGALRGWDLYAAGLSSLCLLHCLALPLLATLLPVAAQLSERPWVHQLLALLAAPATLWVVWRATPISGSRPFTVAALSGLGLLLLAAFVGAVDAHEEPITVAGATLLGSAHLWRWGRHRAQSRARTLQARTPNVRV